MANFVAFEGSQRINANSYLINQNFDLGVAAPQNALLLAVAEDFIDEMLYALMLKPLSIIQINKFNEKIVRQLAVLVTKTTKALAKSILKKRSNEELKGINDYIKDRRLVIENDSLSKTYISLPLSDELYGKFQTIFVDIQNGRVAQSRQSVCAAMLEFSELALVYFYKHPVDLLPLGAISRKMADAGYSTLLKGTGSTISKVFENQSDDELISFIEYFKTLFFTR